MTTRIGVHVDNKVPQTEWKINLNITSWRGMSYSNTASPLAILKDAHLETFNAAESQSSARARSQYLHGLRILESAFNYLYVREE